MTKHDLRKARLHTETVSTDVIAALTALNLLDALNIARSPARLQLSQGVISKLRTAIAGLQAALAALGGE
jgi:hypothetical protein